MIFLLAIAISPVPSSPADVRAIAVCRAKLQARIEGDVSAVEPESILKSGHLTIVRGRVTALVGMGDPGSGFAKAHHLIRESYHFKCSVQSSHVTAIHISRID